MKKQMPGAELLAFKPHIKAHVLSKTEVALIGENGRFALRGQAYALVAPLLDGTRTDNEIVAALSGDLAPEMAYFALETMKARGHVAPMPPGGKESGAGWWHAQGEDPAPRRETAGQARAFVSSIGLEAHVAQALAARIGAAIRVVEMADEATLQVCLVDDYLRPELGQAMTRALEEGRAFLPVRPAGIQIWLGPLCRPEKSPDWPVFLARLRDNRPADLAVLKQGIAFPVVPAVHTPETLDMALSLAASVVVRCASGTPPDFVEGAIWTMDTGSLETRTHTMPEAVPSPRGPDDGPAVPERPIELQANPKMYTADGGHRVCEPEETLERLMALVSPISGIVPDIEKLPGTAGIHVFASTQVSHLGDGEGKRKRRTSPRENRILGRPSGAAGKGQTEVQARVSCLAEAVERYSCGFFGDEPTRRARLDDMGPDAIHPGGILNFSDLQYERRGAFNEAREGGRSFNWVPAPFDPAQPVDWTPVWSLSQGRTRWVPSALCYFGYFHGAAKGDNAFARACSNGCASGNTIEEAILQGLFELVERDACALWWYNMVRRPEIDLASFRQPFFGAMGERYAERDRTLHVLDLTTDLGFPAAMAVSWRKDDGGSINFGLGCHMEPRLAVSRALAEINQMLWFDESGGDRPDETDFLDTDHARWMREATIESQPYVVPLEGAPVSATDMEDHSSDDIASDVRFCVDRLDDLGYETLVFDHSRPDIGFPTARVIVPGLRHFWARLAPGRLYDVPVSLGWLDRPHGEEDLNPIPFFL